jgi:glutamate synthase (ferredoxin)
VTVSTALDYSDRALLRRLVENHHEYTESDRAEAILDDWTAALDDFVRVFPDAYADVIDEGVGSDVREDPPEPARTVYDTGADPSNVVSGDD